MKVFINQHKKMILLSLLLLIVALSIIGTTYAYYRLSFIQNDKSIASSKCFKVTLEDLSDAIVLNDLHPKSDEEGLKSNSYSFNIKNTCDTYATYQVNLEDILDDTITKRLSNKYIKVSLNDGTPKVLNTYQSVTPTINNADASFKLTSGSLGPKGSSNDSVSYNLKFWMDYDTPAIDEVMSATFKSKISVVSMYITEDALNNDLAFNYNSFIDSNGEDTLTIKATSSNYNITEYSFDGHGYTVLDNPGKDISIKNLKKGKNTKIYLKDEVGNVITKDIVSSNIDILTKYTDSSISIKLSNNDSNEFIRYEYSVDNDNFYASNDDSYTIDNLDTTNNNYTVYVKAILINGDSLTYQTKLDKVANIDSTYYSTLDYALSSVSDSGTDIVYLLKDIDTEVVFKENKKASLDLNGHSITCSKETDVLFTNNGDLKIKNGNISSVQVKMSTILNNNKIELENVVVKGDEETEIADDEDGATFYNKGEATINAEIYSKVRGSIRNENILNITGGKVSSSGVSNKSMIGNLSGTITISGGEFTSEQRGILTNLGTINIIGGTFKNTQTRYVSIQNGSSDNTTATMIIDGATIDTVTDSVYNFANLEIKSGNITSKKYVLNNKSGTTTISGGTLKGTGENTSVYNSSGTVNITGGDFSSEQRAIVMNLDKANITGGTFTSTQTGYYNIQNGTSSNNVASMVIDGGVFEVSYNIVNYGDLEIKSGDITAARYALYNKSGTSTISGGTIKGTGSKTAIYNETGILNITGGDFSSEQTGIVTNLDKVNITGGTFTSTQTGYYNIKNGSSSNNVASMVIDGGTIDTVASALINYANLEIKSGNITSANYTLYNDGGTSTISGGTIKGTGSNPAIYNAKGTLNITDGEFSSEQNGIVTSLDKANITGGTFTSTQTGYVNLLNGNNSNNTAIMVIDGATIDTINDSVYNYANLEIKSGNITSKKYVLNNKSGTTNISGGTLKGTGENTSVYNTKGTLNIAGGEFSSEQRGILVNLATANINGGTFTSTQTGYYNISNGSSSNKAAVMVIDGSTIDTVASAVYNYANLEIKSGNITAANYSLHNDSGTSTISGGTIKSTGSKTAIYNEKGTLNITDGEFSGEQNGIVMNLDKANITGGTFTSIQTGYINIQNGSSNSTAAIMVIDGGTIDTAASAVYNYANLEIKSGNITSKKYVLSNSDGTSTISGGTLKGTGENVAIYNTKGTLNITEGKFSSEKGGIIINLATTNITGGTFTSTQTGYYNIQNGSNSNTTATMVIDGGTFETTAQTIVNCANLTINNGEFKTTARTVLYNITGTSKISGGTLTTGNANAINNKANLIINGTASITNNASSYPTVYNYAGSTITTDLTNAKVTNNGGGKTIYNAS